MTDINHMLTTLPIITVIIIHTDTSQCVGGPDGMMHGRDDTYDIKSVGDKMKKSVLALASMVVLSGCAVYPAQPVSYHQPVYQAPVYVAPAPVYVLPPPVVVRPYPYYYGRRYYR